MKKLKIDIWAGLQQATYILFWALLTTGIVVLVYYLGLVKGFNLAKQTYEPASSFVEETGNTPTTNETTQTPKPVVVQKPTWGGPQLWEAVNKRRVELGVNPLSTKSELCTIASIRLNELLDLGTLDAHEGFSKMPETREDLKWIFEKYNLTEFLVAGAQSPDEAVSLWENTLGHNKLLNGGEYVWGCIYAQEGFGVAITAY